MKRYRLCTLVALAPLALLACEPTIDRGTSVKPEEPKSQPQAVRHSFDGSSSVPGKARDVARRTVDKVEQQQEELVRKLERGDPVEED